MSVKEWETGGNITLLSGTLEEFEVANPLIFSGVSLFYFCIRNLAIKEGYYSICQNWAQSNESI